MRPSNWLLVIIALAALLIGSNLWRLDAVDVSEPPATEGEKWRSSPVERRTLIEATHLQNVEYQKLLGIVLRVSKPLEREQVLSALQDVLAIEPIVKDAFVLFGRLVLQFDENERLADLYVAIEGTTTRAEIVIERVTDRDNDS